MELKITTNRIHRNAISCVPESECLSVVVYQCVSVVRAGESVSGSSHAKSQDPHTLPHRPPPRWRKKSNLTNGGRVISPGVRASSGHSVSWYLFTFARELAVGKREAWVQGEAKPWKIYSRSYLSEKIFGADRISPRRSPSDQCWRWEEQGKP